jgi:DNA polymerase-3 subunit beta
MRLSVSVDQFSRAVQTVAPVTLSSNLNPILSQLRLSTDEDAVLVSATNNDQTISIRIEAEIRQSGSTLINPKQIAAILKEGRDETANIETVGTTASVRIGRAEYTLATTSDDGYPTDDGAVREWKFTIHNDDLKEMILATRYAAMKQESARWATSGILLEANDAEAVMCGTDTKRLSIAAKPAAVKSPITLADAVILPLPAIESLLKLCEWGEVVFCDIGKTARFYTDTWSFGTSLVSGRFPPYREILPKNHKHDVTIEAGPFASAIRQAMVTADVDSRRVDFVFRKGEIELTATGPDTGRSRVVFECPGCEIEEFEIALDPKYMLDYLQSQTGAVCLKMTDGAKPVTLKGESNQIYLVMPMTAEKG